MQFKMIHNNINVLDLDKSLLFYKEAFGLTESLRKEKYGEYTIVYLSDNLGPHLLELTWLPNWVRPYQLGDNEFHLAFEVDDFAKALDKHKKMGCVVYENPEMGIYFVEDPDGYWMEVLPQKR